MILMIKDILHKNSFGYKTRGKNVGKGEINIKCPFCSDPSYHLGIHPINGWKCLICDRSGSTRKLIKQLTGKLLPIPERLIFGSDDLRKQIKPISLEKLGFSKNPPKAALCYLENRNLDPNIFIKENNLWFSDLFGGKYKYRIIFPIEINEKICGFVGRDYTGKSPIRYKDYQNGFSPKYTLWGAEKVEGDNLLVVEGIFDKARIDHKRKKICGCLSHRKISKEQLLQIKFFGFKKLFVCIDRDMLNDTDYLTVSKTICDTIAFIVETEVVLIEEEDPGQASIKTINELRRIALGI